MWDQLLISWLLKENSVPSNTSALPITILPAYLSRDLEWVQHSEFSVNVETQNSSSDICLLISDTLDIKVCSSGLKKPIYFCLRKYHYHIEFGVRSAPHVADGCQIFSVTPWPLKAGGYGFTPGLGSSNVASCGETDLRNAREAVSRARAEDREALLGLLRVKGHFLPSQEEVILETDLLSRQCLWSRLLC